MNLTDFVTLGELLDALRNEIDTDYARRIEEIGWPESRGVWAEAQETLKTVDAVIELAETYRLNSPVPETN